MRFGVLKSPKHVSVIDLSIYNHFTTAINPSSRMVNGPKGIIIVDRPSKPEGFKKREFLDYKSL